MIRKQIYINERQERLLKRRAKETGLTEAELIRQSLDQSLSVSAGSWRPDPEAWQGFMSTERRRMRLKVPRAARTWTRDELYDRPRAYRQ